MIIVKVGGGKNINLDYVCEDFALLVKQNRAILIHGGSWKRNEIAEKLGHPTKTVVSPSGMVSVYTDEKGLEIFLMVYAGLINKIIVSKLQRLGVNAVGLCGVDGKTLEGKIKKEILIQEGERIKLLTGNFTGKVEKFNPKLINLLLENDFIPVVCPPALAKEGEIINVDGDSITSLLAKELKAEKIIFLIEAPGFLKDPNDENSLISEIKKEEIDKYLDFAQGRMKRKILAIKEAISSGVKEIYIGDGRIQHPLLGVFEGKGTKIF